jgi:hypothetical protein
LQLIAGCKYLAYHIHSFIHSTLSLSAHTIHITHTHTHTHNLLQTRCLYLDPSTTTVNDIQRELQAVDACFIYNGKPLGTTALLNHVPNNSTVFVSRRRNGGCFMVSLTVLTTICMAVLGSPLTCGFSLLLVPLLMPLLFILPFFCL